jgi:hypothetical protein
MMRCVSIAPKRGARRLALGDETVRARRLNLWNVARLVIGLAHDQHGTFGIANDVLGDGAQGNAFETLKVLRSDNDEIRAEIFGHLDDLTPRFAAREMTDDAPLKRLARYSTQVLEMLSPPFEDCGTAPRIRDFVLRDWLKIFEGVNEVNLTARNRARQFGRGSNHQRCRFRCIDSNDDNEALGILLVHIRIPFCGDRSPQTTNQHGLCHELLRAN